jgi:Flp pilus assembly protein TadG
MSAKRTRMHLSRRQRSSRGAAAVEFALVSLVFFTMLIGAMEMGRLLFYWNTAAEVTRLGARMAVVCDPSTTSRDTIRTRMRGLLPLVAAADITVDYQPGGCTAATCQFVTVSITTTTPIQTYIPFVPLSVVMPAFATTLPRESMQSTFAGVANPACS